MKPHALSTMPFDAPMSAKPFALCAIAVIGPTDGPVIDIR